MSGGSLTPVRRILIILLVVVLATTIVVVGETIAMSEGASTDRLIADDLEPEFNQSVPERGDEYYEAAAHDNSWVSYLNPRDEYRNPYLGDGSGKICVSLRNAEGDVIVGESVPNTTVTIPTGDALAWHSSADPIIVEFPLTKHYERPLDADQFGTNESLPQGDGYLDSHCVEFHGLPKNATIEYGQATIQGEHADDIEVVGYHQQADAAWDTDVDPLKDAVSYEEAGGNWTYQTDASHGQVVVVLQVNSSATTPNETNESEQLNGAVDRPGLSEIVVGQQHNERTAEDETTSNWTGLEHVPADRTAIGIGLVASLGGLALVLLRRT